MSAHHHVQKSFTSNLDLKHATQFVIDLPTHRGYQIRRNSWYISFQSTCELYDSPLSLIAFRIDLFGRRSSVVHATLILFWTFIWWCLRYFSFSLSYIHGSALTIFGSRTVFLLWIPAIIKGFLFNEIFYVILRWSFQCLGM
jgi:hypothetical protein